MTVTPDALEYLESRVVSEEALGTLRALLDELSALRAVADAAAALESESFEIPLCEGDDEQWGRMKAALRKAGKLRR